jgi:hypothetical protein
MADPTSTPNDGPPATPLDDPAFVAGLRPIPDGLPGWTPTWPVVDLSGVTPDGQPVAIELGSSAVPVLLLFLATRCDGCESFWLGAQDGPSGQLPDTVAAVVVTRGPDSVDVDEVRDRAARLGSVPVVMSDAAWHDYRVTGYPFFVLVDPGSRTVLGETVGFGWSDVLALLPR